MIFEIASWLTGRQFLKNFLYGRRKLEPQRTLSFTEEQTQRNFDLATTAILKNDERLSIGQPVRARGQTARREWTRHARNRTRRALDCWRGALRFRQPIFAEHPCAE